ncbi:MAG: aminodeoxychorismate synthase component I [Deltaproteobacteria bacterium]|nr:aminodeoxychorismate synthase component I [Deltaproteobacteria bacterium]
MIIEPVENISPTEAFTGLRHWPYPFMFSGEGINRRYTFISAGPEVVLKAQEGKILINGINAGYADPFAALSELMPKYRYEEKGPFPFHCGAAGYFSYDLKNIIEPKLGIDRKIKDIIIPDCIIGFYDPVFAYDHLEGKGFIVSVSGDKKRIEEFRAAVTIAIGGPYSSEFCFVPSADSISSDTSKEEFIDSVKKAKEYISSGDIYQINLSHRLSIPWEGDAFALYSCLVKTHPMPFSSFMDFGEFQVISNSPERLLKITDGTAETSPIKGTRPRGSTPDEDARLIDELKASRKERAEHVMIVDLERNDLGRISVPGSVEVTGFEAIETYKALHHMISTVKGRLKKGIDTPTALKEIFPGGSITGAPKFRAMEIIDELEKSARGIYTGGIGWIDFNGDADISMAIRTAVHKDGKLFLNVGGGIVADSIPEEEYEETILKAKDFMDVLGLKRL